MDLQDATEKNRFVVQTVRCAVQGFPPLPENTWGRECFKIALSHAALEKYAPSPTVIKILKFPQKCW